MPSACPRVSIVVFPECDPSMVFGVFDTLWAAGRLWDPLTRKVQGKPLFEPQLVAASTTVLKLATGVCILPQQSIDAVSSTDIVFVPNVMVSTSEEVAELDRRLIDWISRMHRNGAVVYAACGGTLVLAETGLLDGKEATTFWGYASLFRERFPRVTLHVDRLLVQSGRGHDLVCAGGASSWQDMVLMLIAKHGGVEEALRVSKMFLYQWHRDGQLPYASMIRNVDLNDAVITDCQEWLADNYARDSVIALLHTRSKLPKRTFDRRFKAATGYSPLAYVQALRIEEAKHLLEMSDDPVDSVGMTVGYQDPASFRRVFSRLAGVSPSLYRRKFQVPKLIRIAATETGPAADTSSVSTMRRAASKN